MRPCTTRQAASFMRWAARGKDFMPCADARRTTIGRHRFRSASARPPSCFTALPVARQTGFSTHSNGQGSRDRIPAPSRYSLIGGLGPISRLPKVFGTPGDPWAQKQALAAFVADGVTIRPLKRDAYRRWIAIVTNRSGQDASCAMVARSALYKPAFDESGHMARTCPWIRVPPQRRRQAR